MNQPNVTIEEIESMTVTVSTNMTCGGCLAKVAPLLENDPTIVSWDSDLNDPRKLVRAELSSEGSPDRIVELMNQAGFRAEVVNEPNSPKPEQIEDGKTTFNLKTYKPLLLVVLYVLGGAFLLESNEDQWNWMRFMSNFMGMFFLGFAFFKLLNVEKFADAFATYDVIARRSRTYAISYPWIEVALGLLFVTGSLLTVANILTAAIMSIGLVGVIMAVRKKQAIQCACLGTAFNLPMSSVTIIENSVMIAMAIGMLVI